MPQPAPMTRPVIADVVAGRVTARHRTLEILHHPGPAVVGPDSAARVPVIIAPSPSMRRLLSHASPGSIPLPPPGPRISRP